MKRKPDKPERDRQGKALLFCEWCNRSGYGHAERDELPGGWHWRPLDADDEAPCCPKCWRAMLARPPQPQRITARA